MKFFLLALLSFYPFLQVKSSTPKAVTCTRTEYREEYIPGTKSIQATLEIMKLMWKYPAEELKKMIARGKMGASSVEFHFCFKKTRFWAFH